MFSLNDNFKLSFAKCEIFTSAHVKLSDFQMLHLSSGIEEFQDFAVSKYSLANPSPTLPSSVVYENTKQVPNLNFYTRERAMESGRRFLLCSGKDTHCLP